MPDGVCGSYAVWSRGAYVTYTKETLLSLRLMFSPPGDTGDIPRVDAIAPPCLRAP
jgi:hypothetical protein